MSAWIVSKRHIDFLVAAIVRSEAVPEAGWDRDAIGQELWNENHASINYCYDEDKRAPKYVFEPIELPDLSDPRGVAFACNQFKCFDYQTCEHPDWINGQARSAAWIEAMIKLLDNGLELPMPAYDRSTHTWILTPDTAPWGIGEDYVCPDYSAAGDRPF